MRPPTGRVGRGPWCPRAKQKICRNSTGYCLEPALNHEAQHPAARVAPDPGWARRPTHNASHSKASTSSERSLSSPMRPPMGRVGRGPACQQGQTVEQCRAQNPVPRGTPPHLRTNRAPPCPHTLNRASTSTPSAVARALVWLAMPITASNSACCASVIPLALAAAVWEWMQYSQPFATDTAT